MAKWREVDKDLVAEQPGWGLSFIGLFLAFFMGLTIRAALSQERVQEHLLHATENVHRDLDIKFKNASISFSRGIWPELAVVIQDVTIQSNQPCYLSPLAEINEVRLPLSFRHLFKGQILIHEILADEVNLSLRSEFGKCADHPPTQAISKNVNHTAEPSKGGTKNEVPEAFVTSSSSPTPSNYSSPDSSKRLIADFENVPRQNPIDTVQIANLKIHYLPYAFTSFYIQDFQALLKAEDPRWISLTGLWNLEGGNLASDSNSFANLQIDSIEGEAPAVKALIRGGWREGQYHLLAHLNPKTQVLDFESSVHHLPLSQIIPILKKYRWVESEFDGRQAWISGNLKFKGPLSELQKTPAQLTGLKLEGELGEVSCNHAEILSWQPLQFKPVDFDIRGLKIKEFLTFLNRPHPSPALGHLGLFTGTAHFISPEQLALRGDYSGLEFIFSNRGTREIQTLSLVSGELELKKKQWQIQLDRVKPAEGVFDGRVTMRADKDFKDLHIDAKINELSLSPRVQTLMTGGGMIGPLSGEVKVQLKKAEISDLYGQLRWNRLLVEGVQIGKPKVNLRTVGSHIHLAISAQDLEFKKNNLFLGPLFAPVFQSFKEGPIVLRSPTALIRTEKLTSLNWDHFQSQSILGTIRSKGQWNQNGDLSGNLLIGGQIPQVWNIIGTRSQPQLVSREP